MLSAANRTIEEPRSHRGRVFENAATGQSNEVGFSIRFFVQEVRVQKIVLFTYREMLRSKIILSHVPARKWVDPKHVPGFPLNWAFQHVE